MCSESLSVMGIGVHGLGVEFRAKSAVVSLATVFQVKCEPKPPNPKPLKRYAQALSTQTPQPLSP